MQPTYVHSMIAGNMLYESGRAGEVGICFSNHFTATNGVRQGGVLNPYPIAYIVELLAELGSSRAGCTVANMAVLEQWWS